MHGSAYTAEDIKRYLSGGMSPAEMHALEKAALDDPFLADAIEGMERSAGNFESNVNELKQRIQHPVSQKPLIKIYWKAAAAILFIATTAVALVVLIDEKQVQPESKVLARVEQKKDTTILLQRREEPAALITEKKQEQKTKAVAPPPTVLYEQETAVYRNIVAATPQAEKSISIADTVQQQLNKRNDTTALNALQGRAAGIDINTKKQPDEVVVTGYGAKKKASRRYTGTSVETRNQQSVAPEGGWHAFDNYLSENKNIAGADSLKTGIEIISFTIDENGRPADFKVRKSISPAHDAEAIKLLTNGPGWQILQGRKRKVRLEIVF